MTDVRTPFSYVSQVKSCCKCVLSVRVSKQQWRGVVFVMMSRMVVEGGSARVKLQVKAAAGAAADVGFVHCDIWVYRVVRLKSRCEMCKICTHLILSARRRSGQHI